MKNNNKLFVNIFNWRLGWIAISFFSYIFYIFWVNKSFHFSKKNHFFFVIYHFHSTIKSIKREFFFLFYFSYKKIKWSAFFSFNIKKISIPIDDRTKYVFCQDEARNQVYLKLLCCALNYIKSFFSSFFCILYFKYLSKKSNK